MGQNLILWSTMVVVVTATAQTSDKGLTAVDFEHYAVLDQRGAFVMMWTPGKDSITVEVQVATTGWVGIGFSPNGGMRGADITLGWVDSQGQLHVHDRYAYGMTTPVVDISQDVVVEGGYQNDTHTVMRFSRPWNTCDTEHDMKLSDDTVRVIWAYGEEDPIDEMNMKRHVERGTKSVYLKEPRLTSLPMTDIKTWDIRSPNVSVPSNTKTLYWCKLVKVPDFGTKVHVIGFKPLISKENLPFVHHMLLYSCGDVSPYLEKWAQHEGMQCFSPNMPPSMITCKSAVNVAWAIGSEGEMFPEHVGIPLGNGSGVSYYVMEIHYDNSKLKEGIVDDSGLRLLYTEKLRKYDAGVLPTGHSVSPLMIVPPKHIWKTVGHCASQCTKMGFPPEGIKVFQVLLHAHLLGRGLTLRHIRDGRELPVISQDLNYDFNYQQGRTLPQEVTILPEDSLIMECQYDARQRTVPTFGGEGTKEEMCLAFLMYYPKGSLESCVSQPIFENIYHTLGVERISRNGSFTQYSKQNKDEKREKELIEALLVRKETPTVKEVDTAAFYKKVAVMEPATMKNKTLYDILLDKETWKDERKLKELQKIIEFGPYQGFCHWATKKERFIQKYPHFTTIETLDDECLAPKVSPEHLPSYQVMEKEGPAQASHALQLAVTLLTLLAPLFLLILFHH